MIRRKKLLYLYFTLFNLSSTLEVKSSKEILRHLLLFYTEHGILNEIASLIFFERASVAHLETLSDWRPGGRGFNPHRGRQHSFVEIDHEIFSTVILSLPLIQEGQLSVSGDRMCTILVNRLEDCLPSKRVVR